MLIFQNKLANMKSHVWGANVSPLMMKKLVSTCSPTLGDHGMSCLLGFMNFQESYSPVIAQNAVEITAND